MYDESLSSRAIWHVKKNFPVADVKPEVSVPLLPDDMTELPDGDLMVMFAEVNSWLDFAETILSAAQVDEKQEQQKLDDIEAREHVKNSGEKNVTLIKSKVHMCPDFTAQRDRVAFYAAKRKMLEPQVSSLMRKQFLISRELSRRINSRGEK